MNWINNLFYMGLLTTLTGSLAFVVYVAAAGILDRLKKYRYIYGMLLLVFPFSMFGEQSDLQARIYRIKQYRVQKELKLPVVVVAGIALFFLASIGLTFGAGIATIQN